MDKSPVGVSFPKSGRTWMRSVLGGAGVALKFTHAGHGSLKRELGRPFAGIPAELAERPVLFLHRNPLDTAVSFYFQVTHKDFARGSRKWFQRLAPLWWSGRLPPSGIDAFVLHPNYGVEAVCRFNRAWIDHLAGREDCMIITYEALRADPRAGFSDVLRFLGRAPEGIDALVEAASFGKMRAREAARLEKAGGLFKPGAKDEGARKVRRGKVGGYADSLRSETIAAGREIAARFGFED